MDKYLIVKESTLHLNRDTEAVTRYYLVDHSATKWIGNLYGIKTGTRSYILSVNYYNYPTLAVL